MLGTLAAAWDGAMSRRWLNRCAAFFLGALAYVAYAQEVAAPKDSAVAVAFVNQLPQILISLGTFAGVVITGLIAWSTSTRQQRQMMDQEKANEKRVIMDNKLDVIHTTTNSLSEAAQEAALQKGIAQGVEKERNRAATEQAAMAKGRLEGGQVDVKATAREAASELLAVADRAAAKLGSNVPDKAETVINRGTHAERDIEAADKQIEASVAQGEAADKQLKATEKLVVQVDKVVKE